MTAEEQRAKYHAKCTHKRVGKSLIDLVTGANENFPSINRAKNAVRQRGLKVYVPN